MNILNFNKNKRGNSEIRMIAVGISVLFGFGFFAIFGYLILNTYITEFTTAGYYTGVTKTVGDSYLFALSLFDYFIVLVMFILIIGTTYASFKLTRPRIFFVLTFIMAFIIAFISYIFNFVFFSIITNPVIIGITTVFPKTIIICTNLHWIALVMIVLSSIAVYGKRDEPQIIT